MSEEKSEASAILEAAKRATIRKAAAVLVPEWNNASVYVRMMNGRERATFDRETIRRKRKERDRVNVRERLVIETAEDSEGRRIFSATDEDMLSEQGVAAVDRIFKVAAKLNGYLDDEDDASGNS